MSVVMETTPAKQTAPKPVVILPAINPLTGDPKNYRVEIAKFGGYEQGNILPKHVVTRSAGSGARGREDAICEGYVKERKLSETYEKVNVELSIPAPKAESDATPDLTRELNTANAEVKRLSADLISVSADRDGWKGQVESRDKSLGEQSATIADLQKTIESQKALIESQRGEANAKIAELTAQLDAATKPADGKKVSK